MSDFSLIGGTDALEVGYDYSATNLTVLTAGGSANTLGSYVELLSAANNDRPIAGVIIQCVPNTSGAQGESFVNIAIGGAGSEEIIVPNLFVTQSVTAGNIGHYTFNFPVSIPSGVRISAAMQSNVASEVYSVSLILLRSSLAQPSTLSTIDSIGADTATTDGILVATAGTTNTFGSWVEMTASSDEAYKGLIVAMVKVGGSWSSLNVTYEVGVGGAGNEEVIFSGQHAIANALEMGGGLVSPFIPVDIPQGVRLAIRAQSNSTNTDKDFNYVIYGVR